MTPMNTPMSTTFAPRPGAASLPRMVVAQALMEARLMMRNGEQLLLAVVIPLIVLVVGVRGTKALDITFQHASVDVFTPGVLALAVMSTAFTSLAITTGFERRYGVIKRLGSSPLPRSGLLAGKVCSLLLVELGQLVVIGSVGLALGWNPDPSVVGTFLAFVLGTAAFASLGLFVAGVLRAEATLAAANLIYLLLMAGGAVIIPSVAYGALGNLVRWLPSGALGDAMRDALIRDTIAWSNLLVLLVWAAIGTFLTARTFRWE
jgi:ABC-2 type transport system permease protein